ncbi:MAG: vWA domain-containing protein [Promethearchaeota archaeon]
MFEDFFYLLREVGIPVSITEWLTLMDALNEGLAKNSLYDFYFLSRAVLIKDIKYYDHFDQAFAFYFKGKELPKKIREELLKWLEDPADILLGRMSGGLDFLKNIDLQKLFDEFEKLRKKQDERHDLGNRWIGTGGESAYGNSGRNPAGIRVGGSGGGRSAIQVASLRKFHNYRHDITLDTRQIKVALKKLRTFKRRGVEDELDLDETIDETARNCGDIELVFRPPRKNQIKLALFMDAGGSMDPFASLVNILFSAAHASNHFKDFKYYYFHNCIYEFVYKDIEMDEQIPTARIMRELDRDYRVIVVGDAAMAPYELTAQYGSIYYYHRNETAGIDWLKRFKRHFRKILWINPVNPRYWGSYSTEMIRNVFQMFPLTLDGLDDSIKALI